MDRDCVCSLLRREEEEEEEEGQASAEVYAIHLPG